MLKGVNTCLVTTLIILEERAPEGKPMFEYSAFILALLITLQSN